jgi:capsular polysaccharide transport system permease protein
LLMRELHTRYGRENIGYLWLVGEPMMLGTVIGLMHSGASRSMHEGAGISPVAFAIVGYTVFIMFRGIVNRSEGSLEANAPLMFHSMVTVLDIVMAKALLEAAGTFMSFLALTSILTVVGVMSLPPHPLFVILAVFYIFWFSTSISLIVIGGTYRNGLLERLVAPFSYFMIPLSGAFFRIEWIPEPYRHWLLWNPFPQMFEMLRYGEFENCSLEYVDFLYITAFCASLTLVGLAIVRNSRSRMHL